jgi:GNAT superfamily N-acetyltransferase
MKFIEDLISCRLYPANKKIFAPINLKSKQKGAAIMLLAPSNTSAEDMLGLPYIYNPNYFRSYYIARDVTAYIDHNRIEVESEMEDDSLQESFYFKDDNKKISVDYDSSCSITTRKYIDDTILDSKWLKNMYGQLHASKYISNIACTVYEYRSFEELNRKLGTKHVHGYANDISVHIISESSYNKEDGEYEHYVKHEFCSMIIHNMNPQINPAICSIICGYLSEQYKDDVNDIKSTGPKASLTLSKLVEKKGFGVIDQMIRDNDISPLANYAGGASLKTIMSLFEASMSSSERKSLKDSDFGIPDQRKYPLNDEAHVRAAIKMFNHVDSEHEAELAKRIKSAMKKFGITDVEVGKANKFSKYYSQKKSIKEATVTIKNITKVVSDKDGYERCKKVFDGMSKEDQDYACPHGYVDSERTVYRDIIEGENGKAGFLEAHMFKPDSNYIYITIAVDKDLRGTGIADKLVTKMMQTMKMCHPTKTLIWKVDKKNIASIKLAERHGFTWDVNHEKLVYKLSSEALYESCIAPVVSVQDLENDGYSMNENFLRVGSAKEGFMVFFNEADAKYDSMIKRYIFKERIKNVGMVKAMYDRVRANNPWIMYTFPSIKQYKEKNIFVDISYYNNLFLNGRSLVTMSPEKKVKIYWDFMNRLINNKEIDDVYPKKTIFINIDPGVWGTEDVDAFVDYKQNLNPISVLFRLLYKDPVSIKQEWGNKRFLFCAKRGYFTIDFTTFGFKHIARIKKHLRKLFSSTEPIIDDEDPKSSLAPDEDSPTVIATKLSEKIGDSMGVEIPVSVDGSGPYGNDHPLETDVDKLDDLILYSSGSPAISSEKQAFVAVMGDSTEDIINIITGDKSVDKRSILSNAETITSYVKID